MNVVCAHLLLSLASNAESGYSFHPKRTSSHIGPNLGKVNYISTNLHEAQAENVEGGPNKLGGFIRPVLYFDEPTNVLTSDLGQNLRGAVYEGQAMGGAVLDPRVAKYDEWKQGRDASHEGQDADDEAAEVGYLPLHSLSDYGSSRHEVTRI
eukprot:GHVH01013723.1.p1 GENE.GHVH01013723.1~~GHVH01013723.1.p1  ORF type:complete len:152 (-),score=19.58 GHVH01013723.1:92-547(-)